MRRFDQFVPAFAVQKLLELVLLGLCLSVFIYVGTRLPDPEVWGMFNATPIGLWNAALAGFTGAGVFFLFTFYPLVTFVLVALARRRARTLRALSLTSAIVSVGYVLLWVFVLKFPFIGPHWIITAIMAAFVFAASMTMYPALDNETSSSA
jgi:hypothetical protein